MNVVIVGLSHNSAPVEIRERLSFPETHIEDDLKRLVNCYGINEGVILSTCNRVEIIAVMDDADTGVSSVKRFLADSHRISLDVLDEYLYVYANESSIRHLFRVSSGLDSMVIGEPQIFGQVKDAYDLSHRYSAAGIVINKLFHKAFNVAKRIRTETSIASNAVSIGYAAVELSKKIFGELKDKSIMLVGAGEMAELAARHLITNGVSKIIVANRTYERGIEMAKGFGGTPVMFREFPHFLKDVDIVITSTGAPRFIIRPEQIQRVVKERRNKPMFFIDISVPRNIDPLINNIDNVYLYDIDDLSGVVAANLKDRKKEAVKAEEIIDEEITSFYLWVKSLNVVPTIIALRKHFDSIRRNELNKAFTIMDSLDASDKKIIETMTASIINKILHGPVTHLKREAHSVEGDFYMEATRKMFDLEEDGAESYEKIKEG